MLGQQAEVTADDDGSYLRQAFDAIDRGGPRLGRFRRRDSDKGNWTCLASLRAARAQSLNLLRIARSPTGIVHLNGPHNFRRQLTETRSHETCGYFSGEHSMGRLRHQQTRQAHRCVAPLPPAPKPTIALHYPLLPITCQSPSALSWRLRHYQVIWRVPVFPVALVGFDELHACSCLSWRDRTRGPIQRSVQEIQGGAP